MTQSNKTFYAIIFILIGVILVLGLVIVFLKRNSISPRQDSGKDGYDVQLDEKVVEQWFLYNDQAIKIDMFYISLHSLSFFRISLSSLSSFSFSIFTGSSQSTGIETKLVLFLPPPSTEC